MVNENINSFINYNYIPFDKKQCVKRLILLWILSVVVPLIGKLTVLWGITIALADVLIAVLFLILIIKFSQKKSARFLCDGGSCLYLSLILDFAAYRVLVLQTGNSRILFFAFLLLLVVNIFVCMFLFHQKVQSDKYWANPTGGISLLTPLVGGSLGYVIVRFFSPDNGFIIISVCLLIASLLISLGSINLLKVFFLKKIEMSES